MLRTHVEPSRIELELGWLNKCAKVMFVAFLIDGLSYVESADTW